MAEPTSKELEEKLKEQDFKRDKNDPPNQYYGPNQEKVWTDGDYMRTENDSTYRKS